MKTQECDCRHSCIEYATVASIVIGVIAGILRYTAVITFTPAFLWVTLGIAVVYLALDLLTSSIPGKRKKCVCERLRAQLTGILGTVLTSIILLGVAFAATSVLGAIIAGLLMFFFSLMITATACLIKCKENCDYSFDSENE